MDFFEKNRGIVLAIVVVIIIGLFGYSLNADNKNVDTNKVAKKTNENLFSQDDKSKPFKSLSYKDAIKKLKDEKATQAFYIGCRYCPHCINLENIMEGFLNNNKNKNKKRDLIYRIEAGYRCTPQEGESQRTGYEKIYQFLVDNQVITANEQKGFGTPQFIFVKNGKVIDTLDKYGRDSESLKKLFQTHNYRGFKK